MNEVSVACTALNRFIVVYDKEPQVKYTYMSQIIIGQTQSAN